MGSILDNNKSFCLAPWIHSYISPQGLRQICCVAEHNFGINQSLESIWNSDEMKDIRTKMMNGEILSACNRCNDKSINPNPYRDYFNRQYEWYTNDIITPAGPENYGLLPGLILEIDVDNGTTVFKATEVKASLNKKELKEPTKGKIIGRKEFQKLQMDMMQQEMPGMMQMRRGNN